MIVEFVDGTTASIISFVSKRGDFSGTISTTNGYISYAQDATHVAVVSESGRPETYTRIYPIDKVLCIHKDITTLRDKKINTILT